MNMIESLKEGMNKSLKEIYENTNISESRSRINKQTQTQGIWI